jgi:transposase
MRKKYPTDLTDEEWQILEALVPPIKSCGRPANYPEREMPFGIEELLARVRVALRHSARSSGTQAKSSRPAL